MKQTVTCVICPRGCSIEVTVEEGKEAVATGFGCKRGEQYAKAEVVCPERILTSTVKLSDGSLLPVRSQRPIPKSLLLAAAKALSGRVFDGTYRMGDVVVADILGTGVDMVAGRHSGEAAKN